MRLDAVVIYLFFSCLTLVSEVDALGLDVTFYRQPAAGVMIQCQKEIHSDVLLGDKEAFADEADGKCSLQLQTARSERLNFKL